MKISKYLNTLKVTTVTLLPISLAFSCSSKTEKTVEKTPNVIFILADDLGIGDLGCYGQQQIKTPAIDALAKNGMKFTNHYSGSTVSAPSRCVLMTGKHTGHSYIRGNHGVKDEEGDTFDYPIADKEITVAEVFKQANYNTACIGKWGLGGPHTEGHPNRQGFDYFFGYLGQANAHRYYPQFIFENDDKIQLNKEHYAHDLIADKAIKFIEENSDKPFFLYFSPTIPHADLTIPTSGLGEYDNMFDDGDADPASAGGYIYQPKPRATFAAMVTRLDSDVQSIVNTLKDKGILDNTIIIFSSDNGTHSEGGHDPHFFKSSGKYRGQKRDLYEGGIHTPFVVQYPAVIKEGQVNDHVSTFWDFLPTICDLIDVQTPENIDGISYLSTLTGEGTQKEHDNLYYEFHEMGGKRAVIKDGWKLIELNVNEPEKRTLELYNINIDIEEKNNVVKENPELVENLTQIMLSSRTDNPIWNFK